MASTSSIRASESASRSSANDWPSLMELASISRMSARRSRISSKTAWRSIGPCSTWVSAGTRWRVPVSQAHKGFLCPRNRLPEVPDQVVVDHVAGHADGVADRPGGRRPVADDADAVDAEKHRSAVGLGVELHDEGLEDRPDLLEQRVEL